MAWRCAGSNDIEKRSQEAAPNKPRERAKEDAGADMSKQETTERKRKQKAGYNNITQERES
eukprot:11676844-Alexandrium_andersonii.AAC.1